MIVVTFNGTEELMNEIDEFGAALDRFDAQLIFELWLNAPGGASMSMLRNSEHAFLMYPRSWCIPLEECYKALAYFFVNDGMRPEWLQWHERAERATA